MDLKSIIPSIEVCKNREELRDRLQHVIESFGFSAFCFLDISDAYKNDFLYFGTTGERWEKEYLNNSFFDVDEILKVGRRTNRPFSWDDVPLPPRLGKKLSGAHKVFEAANDYRYNSGHVIPLHFVDPIGRYHSVVCSLFWADSRRDFARVREESAFALHVILTYWIQRVVDLKAADLKPSVSSIFDQRRSALEFKLTDRERDCLSWAARGKTTRDTAEILKLSEETVTQHLKSGCAKLGASNKTHAAAKALHLGIIDF